jgi:type I restriction enzyme, S subunit
MILNEVCEFIIDTEHKTAPNVDLGIPSIRTPNVGKGRLILDKDIKYVDEPTFVEWTKRGIPKNGDLIIAREAPVGNVAIVPDIQLCLGQRTVLVRPDNSKANSGYLCYYLLSPKMQYKMLAGSGGSTVAHLNMKDIRNLELEEIPPLPTQRKIAFILSAYDDLIENNLKRIKLLEEKAFLRYKLIVMEEKLEKVKLSEVAVLNQESLKGNSTLEKLLYVDIASVSTGSIDNKTEYDIMEAPGRAKRILKHQDIIWSCVRPNRKSFSFVWKPEENLIASTGFAVITAKAIPATFLYQLITTNEFVNYLENHAKGATYPAVTASDFEDATIQIASNSIMKEYNEEVYQFFELKQVLQKQNTKLREARDILLPRLMNGQIEV